MKLPKYLTHSFPSGRSGKGGLRGSPGVSGHPALFLETHVCHPVNHPLSSGLGSENNFLLNGPQPFWLVFSANVGSSPSDASCSLELLNAWQLSCVPGGNNVGEYTSRQQSKERITVFVFSSFYIGCHKAQFIPVPGKKA